MGGKSKPRASQYAASDTERTQARIAKKDADYFAKTYDPLLVKMRDKARDEKLAGTLRGRAGADTMQTLTGTSSMPHSGDIDLAGDLATAATGQMLSADVAARKAKLQDKIGVLTAARGQASDTGNALAQAARLRTSEDLTRIGVKQKLRLAKRKAAFDIGASMAFQGIQNYQQTGSPLSQHLGYVKDTNMLSPTYGDVQQRIGKGFFGGFKSSTQPLQSASSIGGITGTIPGSSSGSMGGGIGSGISDYLNMQNMHNRRGRFS